MKRIIFAMGIAALVLSSCTKEMTAPEALSQKESGLTLVGYAAPDAKIAIGELTNNVYPILWKAGDKIGIHNCTAGSDMRNLAASLHSSSDGKNSGVFVTFDDYTLAEGTNELIIHYPYSIADSTKIDVEAKTANGFLIPAEQKQPQAGDNTAIGNYSFAYALTTQVKGSEEKPTFTLNHVNTYVKITVSSSEFSSYKLQRVALADKSATPETLSGSVTVNLANGQFTVKNGAPVACVTIEDPKPLTQAQDVYLSVLPCDFTGKDAYIVITMTNDKQTVTIPVTVSGKKILANALNIIQVADVKTSDNKCTWFDPVETRYLAGGWCYGPENTIPLINGGDAVTVNAKAHGDFAYAVEPKAVTVNFTYQHDAGNKYSNIIVNDEALSGVAELFCKTTGYKVIKKFALDPSYNFTVKSLDVSGWGAPGSLGKLILLDANDNPIWAFNLWNMKNPIKEFTTKNGYTLMDKNLGACSYEETTKSTRASAYFQWGRPFALPWGASFVDAISTNAVSLKESAQNCYRMLKYSGAPFTTTDWYLGQAGENLRTEHRDDLWGNANADADLWETDGVKSIFDPCPKGWMVASPKALSEIEQNGVAFEAETDMFWIKYEKSKDEIVYFPYGGLKWGESGGNPNDNKKDVCAMWTNMSYSNYANTNYSSYMVWWRCKGVLANNALQNLSQGRATAAPVRCMKDKDNR